MKGKWFTYSLLGCLLFIDCYLYKNQVAYRPKNYNQYIDTASYIICCFDDNKNQTTEESRINARYMRYDEDITYGVSLFMICSSLIFSIVIGIVRSFQLRMAKNAEKENKMRGIPRIEDIKRRNCKHQMELKSFGNMKTMYSA